MSKVGSLAPRLLVVAVVALGLIGMHHLVVAACHHAVGYSHSSVSDSPHASHGHAVPASADFSPWQAPQEAPESPGGLVGAAATCLTVLLMIVGLVMPHLLARVRRSPSMRWKLPVVRVQSTMLKPPDLMLLSVSRT